MHTPPKSVHRKEQEDRTHTHSQPNHASCAGSISQCRRLRGRDREKALDLIVFPPLIYRFETRSSLRTAASRRPRLLFRPPSLASSRRGVLSFSMSALSVLYLGARVLHSRKVVGEVANACNCFARGCRPARACPCAVASMRLLRKFLLELFSLILSLFS